LVDVGPEISHALEHPGKHPVLQSHIIWHHGHAQNQMTKVLFEGSPVVPFCKVFLKSVTFLHSKITILFFSDELAEDLEFVDCNSASHTWKNNAVVK
jgi:hypothetical protein